MKKLLVVLFLMPVLTSLACEIIPASEIIRDRYDVVVYGTVDISLTPTITIQHSKINEPQKLYLVRIQPYQYLPQISPHYFWSDKYPVYVRDYAYEEITKKAGEYTQQPRFWGIRQTFLFGDLGYEISVRGDESLLKLENDIQTVLKDPTRIRPLDLTPIHDKLNLAFDDKGNINFSNNSSYSVWLHQLSGERYNSKEDIYCFSITGLKRNSWRGSGGSMHSSYEPDKKYNLNKKIKPGESASWKIEPGKSDGYEYLRAEIYVYPDESGVNSITVVSNPVKF